MRTQQLTEQYGQVERVSVARAIFSSLSCATAGVRSNPRIEKPAPPTSAPLRKFLRENSIALLRLLRITSRPDCTPNCRNYNPDMHQSQCGMPSTETDLSGTPDALVRGAAARTRPGPCHCPGG